MILFDYSDNDPWGNIAIDEAMLETAEQHATAGEMHGEILRVWEPQSPAVVLGRSSPWSTEVNHDFCEQNQIPVIRRCSGGQSVVIGPGCLMYAVLIDYRLRPELRMLDTAHQFVMQTMQSALARLDIKTQMEGTSDLTFEGRKVSGNSLRCKRNWMLYHGTMICDLGIELISNCLGRPARHPEYRNGRSHEDFLAQLPTTTSLLKNVIIETWQATPSSFDWPSQMSQELAEGKYRSSQWTQKVS